MIDIFLLEGILVIITVVAAIVAWSLYGTTAIEVFGPRIRPGEEIEDDPLEERRRRGRIAEIARAIVAMLISTTILLTFDVKSIDFVSLFRTRWFPWLIGVPSFITILWCCYFGPKNLADKAQGNEPELLSKEGFREFIRPYMFWIPYIIGVYYLMGGLAVITMTEVAYADYKHLSDTASSLQNFELLTMQDGVQGAFSMVAFGRWMVSASQKYLVVGILLFTFLIIEQHSYMKTTQLLTNLNFLKIGVGLLLLGTVVAGLVIVPMEYGRMFARFQMSLETRFASTISMDDLGILLNLQQFLDDHDHRWLFLSILTGRGNLLALVFLGGIVLIKRAFFEEIPWKLIEELVLPSFAIKWLENIRKAIGITGLPAFEDQGQEK